MEKAFCTGSTKYISAVYENNVKDRYQRENWFYCTANTLTVSLPENWLTQCKYFQVTFKCLLDLFLWVIRSFFYWAKWTQNVNSTVIPNKTFSLGHLS